MEQSLSERKQSDWISSLTGFARREPARVLMWLLGLHLVVWTVLPLLVCRNLQLDLAEGLALGKEWQLGYWKLPPLPWWIDDLAYRAIGDVHILYLLGPLATVIAFYAVWRLGLKIVSAEKALIAVLALEGVHFFNFTAVKFNHDVLQLPLWAMIGLFVYRAITGGRTRDWIWSGIWLALAFWTKYPALALAATIGLVLLLDPFARSTWRTLGPYLMAAVFLIVIAPHLWWLIEHDFVPLHYADVRAKVAAHWYEFIVFPARWILSQVFFLLPAIALLAILLIGERRSEPASTPAFARRYVVALALGPFTLITLGAAVLGRLPVAMWGYPLWTFAPLAVVMFSPALEPPRQRLFARACLLVLIAMPLAYAGIELFEPFLRDRPKATQFAGRLLAETITRQWREATGTPLTYVAGADFGPSGAGEFAANTVAVYSPDHPHVVVHGDPKLSPWIDHSDLKRRGAVLIWEAPEPARELPDKLRITFPRAELQPPLALRRQTLYPRKPSIVNYALVPPQRLNDTALGSQPLAEARIR
jgi:4-amino-4-deoxy-L-arabinose transferase-like glycosyltransferase